MSEVNPKSRIHTDEIRDVKAIGKATSGSACWIVNAIRVRVSTGSGGKVVIVAIIDKWISENKESTSLCLRRNATQCCYQTWKKHQKGVHRSIEIFNDVRSQCCYWLGGSCQWIMMLLVLALYSKIHTHEVNYSSHNKLLLLPSMGNIQDHHIYKGDRKGSSSILEIKFSIATFPPWPNWLVRLSNVRTCIFRISINGYKWWALHTRLIFAFFIPCLKKVLDKIFFGVIKIT